MTGFEHGPLVSEATALPTEPHNHCRLSLLNMVKGHTAQEAKGLLRMMPQPGALV